MRDVKCIVQFREEPEKSQFAKVFGLFLTSKTTLIAANEKSNFFWKGSFIFMLSAGKKEDSHRRFKERGNFPFKKNLGYFQRGKIKINAKPENIFRLEGEHYAGLQRPKQKSLGVQRL